MHKRVVVGVGIFLGVLILLLVPGIFDMLFALVFIGVIPFTTVTLPPTLMKVIYAALIIFGMYQLVNQSFTSADPVKREEVGRKRARKKITKHAKNLSKNTPTRPKKRYQPVTEN